MDLKQKNLNELIKIGIEQRGYPQFIFKYRPLNLNTDKIFTDSELWFSKPFDFNDPFDCQIAIDTTNTLNELYNFIKQNQPLMPDKDVIILAQGCVNNPTYWKGIVNTTIRNSINEKGVCCFAGKNDNILMWSHYTNSHKGICLKFDMLGDIDFFTAPLNVIYSNDYPYYNHLKDNSQLITSLIQTKSSIWEYEEEVRILKTLSGAYKFKKEALKEICFGCNCSNSDIDRIKNLATSNGFNVAFVRAVKNNKRYILDIKKI